MCSFDVSLVEIARLESVADGDTLVVVVLFVRLAKVGVSEVVVRSEVGVSTQIAALIALVPEHTGSPVL